MSETNSRTGENSGKKSTTFVVFSTILSLVVLGGLLFSLFLNFILMVGLAAATSGDVDTQGEDTFKIKVIEGKDRKDVKDQILVIPVEGMIISGDPGGFNDSFATPKSITEKLKKAAENNDIKGVILKINSPGGTITATDEIYRSIIEYKSKTNKPVVAYMHEVAASGGYYIAAPCDLIVASSSAITGSIGVIMSYYQVQDLLENKLGVKQIVIKSGQHKDIGSMSRDLSESEKEILDSVISEMYQRFIEVVKQGRKPLAELPEDQFAPLVDGRIFTGKQAQENGLVDVNGSFDTAVDETVKILQTSRDKIKLIKYLDKNNFWQQLFEASKQPHSDPKAMHNLIQQMTSPKFYYLWK